MTGKTKIELVDEEFPDDDSDKNAKDAEILSETIHDETTKELTGVAALLANLTTETEVAIIVTRLNDRQYKKQFRIPSETDFQIETLTWDGQPFPDGHYDYIQKKYGGGHYRFQLRYDGGFKQAWKIVLSDPAELSDREKLLQPEKPKTEEQPRINQPSQPFVSPPAASPKSAMADLISQLQEFKQLQELLAPPQPPVMESSPQLPTVVTKESIQLKILEAAKTEPELLKMCLQSIFNIAPGEEPAEPQGFWNTIGMALVNNENLQNKLINLVSDGASAFAGPIANLILPKPPAQQTTPASFSINSFRKPREETQPAPAAENPSEVTENVKEDAIPFIAIEE